MLVLIVEFDSVDRLKQHSARQITASGGEMVGLDVLDKIYIAGDIDAIPKLYTRFDFNLDETTHFETSTKLLC